MRLTDEEKEEYSRENKKLIYYFVSKYKRKAKKHLADEIESAVFYAAAYALSHFDKSADTKFSTFFGVCAWGEVSKVYKRHERKSAEISMDAPLSVDENLTLGDRLAATEEEQYEWDEINRAVNKVYQSLSKRDKMIFNLFIQNRKQWEIAEIVDLSQSMVSKVIVNTLNAVRDTYWGVAVTKPVIRKRSKNRITKEKLLEYMNAGLTNKEIAEIENLTTRTICQYKVNFGIGGRQLQKIK